MTFVEAVLAERALLALRDPAGELDAVAPMHRAQAEYLFWLNGGTLRSTSNDVDERLRHLSLGGDRYTSEQRASDKHSGPPEGGNVCSTASEQSR